MSSLLRGGDPASSTWKHLALPHFMVAEMTPVQKGSQRRARQVLRQKSMVFRLATCVPIRPNEDTTIYVARPLSRWKPLLRPSSTLTGCLATLIMAQNRPELRQTTSGLILNRWDSALRFWLHVRGRFVGDANRPADDKDNVPL